MSSNNLNARMTPGRYTWSAATTLGPLHAGHNPSDNWAGVFTISNGATVRDAVQKIVEDVALQKRVSIELINVVSYSFQQVS